MIELFVRTALLANIDSDRRCTWDRINEICFTGYTSVVDEKESSHTCSDIHPFPASFHPSNHPDTCHQWRDTMSLPEFVISSYFRSYQMYHHMCWRLAQIESTITHQKWKQLNACIRCIWSTHGFKFLPLPLILPFSHWPTKRFPFGYKLVPSPQILSSVHEPSTQAEFPM